MPEPISGPYKFGRQHPPQLFGWRPDLVQQAEGDTIKFQSPFHAPPAATENPPPPIWTLTKKLNNGNHLPTVEQGTGDCVAAGLAQAGARLQVADIAARFQEEQLLPWHIAYIYGISRVQIGGGNIPGPGSTGAWGAAAVNKYGVLFNTDAGAPAYSGSLSDRWGEPPGPPVPFQELAEDNIVQQFARLTSIAELREALVNYHPVTIASMQGFKMEPIIREGYHVFQPEGQWPHQMCLLAWMDEPFQAAYRLNSWGPDAHGTPLRGEPPGGAWCTADVLEKELACSHCELFTYSLFDGFPAAVDRGLL